MWAFELVAPRELALVDVASPQTNDLEPGEVLLTVLAGGICGSDMPSFKGVRTAYVSDTGDGAAHVAGFPMHEVVGRVMASRHPDHLIGSNVVGWAFGFNALAEQVVVRGEDIEPYEDWLAPEQAVMLQPLACAMYAVDQLGDLQGVRAAVLGQGPIGVLFSHVLHSRGARVTGVDVVDRSGLARVFGVDEVVHATTDRWATGLEGAKPDLVVEAIGHRVGTLADAVTAVRPGGRIYYFGIPDDAVYPFPMRTFLRHNLTLIAGITLERRAMVRAAQAQLNAHRELVDAYVTHVVPARDAQRAFDLAAAPSAGQLKIVISAADRP